MAKQPFPSIAFLWPALAAASAGQMASALADELVRLAGAVAPPAEVAEPLWTTCNRVALELPTMLLRDFSGESDGVPQLVCVPFALHQATIADFAAGHSLIAALRAQGLSRLFLTDWRSATADMRFFSIDTYLADLNVAVDELGGRVDLIGLCQGGWMALLFAARFPAKARKLVLAGAPVDIAAGESHVSKLAATVPLSVFKDMVRLGEGRILSRRVLELWGPPPNSAAISHILQLTERLPTSQSAVLQARFRDWYARTVDLPGRYYLEVVEWLFKQNRLAEGRLVALGHRIDLGAMQSPIFLLAARDDELVAPQQVLETASRVGTNPDNIRTAVAPCQHLSLFMGSGTLATIWPDIVGWLVADEPARGQSHAA